MLLFRFSKLLGLLLLAIGSASGGAYLYHRYRDASWERRQAEYQRQLHGQLTERERQIEALNTQLGLARSQLVEPGALERQYQAHLTAMDASFEQFRREHALHLKSLSSSLLELQQQSQGGTEKAQELPAPPGGGGSPSAHPATSYEYADTEGRVLLTDPDIWVQGNEQLELKQHFRVEASVLQQADGSLMTERIQLLEVAPTGAGQYRTLAEARLVDARFTYANAPLEDPPPPGMEWGPSWMATLGTSLRAEGRLRFGASARLVRLGAFGLATGISSDFKSREGSGAEAFLTYSPSLRGRELGLVLGGGVHLPVAGAQRVLPSLTLNFVVY